MEQHTPSPLFQLRLDQVSKSYLLETAKWARFLAILGMVSLALMIVFGFFFAGIIGNMGDTVRDEDMPAAIGSDYYRMAMSVLYVLIALIWFLPMLYLLRFGNAARTALQTNDQQVLTVALQNLKACFRYMGIVTIILLAVYAVLFAIILMAGMGNLM